jgi:hypothetical protein
VKNIVNIPNKNDTINNELIYNKLQTIKINS